MKIPLLHVSVYTVNVWKFSQRAKLWVLEARGKLTGRYSWWVLSFIGGITKGFDSSCKYSKVLDCTLWVCLCVQGVYMYTHVAVWTGVCRCIHAYRAQMTKLNISPLTDYHFSHWVYSSQVRHVDWPLNFRDPPVSASPAAGLQVHAASRWVGVEDSTWGLHVCTIGTLSTEATPGAQIHTVTLKILLHVICINKISLKAK